MLSGEVTQHGGAWRCASHAAFDRWEQVAGSRAAVVVMAAWAIAEATVWPIIPAALLVPLSIAHRRRYYIRLAAAVAGMALGGIGLYLFAYEAPQRALLLLRHLPLVGNKHIASAHASMAAHGAAAFLIQP